MADTLSDYFEGIASKYLSEVETSPSRSNQHEFNGSAPLRVIFGCERQIFDNVTFIYLGEDIAESFDATGSVTWYDARENHPARTEYRLYYTGNQVMDVACGGDLLVIGLRPDRTLYVIVAKSDSQAEEQLSWLFGTPEEASKFKITKTEDYEVGFVERYILAHLDITIAKELPYNILDDLIHKFGSKFPSTTVFTNYIWEMFPELASEDPDMTLLNYVEQEEMAFRVFEEYLIMERLDIGFSSIGDFEGFAKGWINRRYSRAGHSFENHLGLIFLKAGIRHSRQKITEQRKKPDFIFPDILFYHRLPRAYVPKYITMLAAKRTCKDRWRQVISEADLLPEKHLITLEPRISINQTDEMQKGGLRLIVPKGIQKTYTNSQREWLMNLEEFMEMVLYRQTKGITGDGNLLVAESPE